MEQKSAGQLQRENEKLRQKLEEMEQELLMTSSRLNHIQSSRTYRMAQKAEKLFDRILPADSMRYRAAKRVWRMMKQATGRQTAARPLTQGQMEALRSLGQYARMDVVTVNHTMYIAKLVKRELERLEIECRIHVGEPAEYEDIPYVIICPQFVERFPKVYFVVQMEQTIASRWFTEDYLVKLKNACGVLDYALENVDFFQKPQQKELSRSVYYLPIDYYPQYAPKSDSIEKEYDVLFYGDAKNLRRRDMLHALSSRFRVKICSDLYGEDVYREIRKAKVLVNIHYYDGALLETTRLYETLSLNSTMIVSEDSEYTAETERLAPFVDFVPVGDTDALIERIAYWLEHDAQREERIRANQAALESRVSAFSFYFLRFLLAHDRIDFETFYGLAGEYVQLHSLRLCLNLPESTQRRRSFDKDNRYGFVCVPGLRHLNGWVGCGMSYKMIMRRAQAAGLPQVMVCEDDVIFPEDFENRLDRIQQYLDGCDRWSLFSGVMADVGDVQVCAVKRDGETIYAQIDRMMSMVFNIYHSDLFPVLGSWDEQDRNETRNTIDRYLESRRLSVHVQIPFLVGHKEELNSTIWDWSNLRYKQLIDSSEKTLLKLVERFEQQG